MEPERRPEPEAEEAIAQRRFVDAGFAIGSLLVEAGYLPDQRYLRRVFERLYDEFAPVDLERPDAQAGLARGFLDGLQQAGFERPSWMRTNDWMRWALSLSRRQRRA